MARLEQRTDDLAVDVRTLAPLVVAVAEVRMTINQVQREQGESLVALQDLRREIKAGEKSAADGLQALRRDIEAKEDAAENRRLEERRDNQNFRRGFYLACASATITPLIALAVMLLFVGHA